MRAHKHIPRIYIQQPLNLDASILVRDQIAHHLLHVMRVKVGRTVYVFNDQQQEFLCEVTETARHAVTLLCREAITRQTESPCKLHLYQAIARGDRMDFGIQKAVELGVTAITPMVTEHSLSHKEAEKRLVHWQGVIVSACEQCERQVIPALHAPQTFDEVLTTTADQTNVLLHVTGEVLSLKEKPTQINLFIGPEGDFSDEELSAAATAHRLRLGPRIMRTETATAAAIAILQSQFGDF
ncbi:MAG: ribosomal RNA small subunit methyltransferase E [marine bacterium B5-7]|nr:MAG: ribosomal RNA small subunit methyltransferase E [marine bacterium B5-7]